MYLEVSRRDLLLAAAGLAGWNRLYASSADFWNKKPPAQWTPEEIDRLTTKSPWAKPVKAQGTASYSDGGARQRTGTGYPGSAPPTIGLPRIGIGGRGGGMGRGGGGNRSPRQTSTTYTGTVRWESAQPVLDALKAPLAKDFDGHYVISVSGFPLQSGRRMSESNDDDSEGQPSQDSLDNLRQSTILQPKGKELVQAGIVRRDVSNGVVILFGFSRELLPLTPADKEVEFQCKLPRVLVKAKFELKEMLYHGSLAV